MVKGMRRIHARDPQSAKCSQVLRMTPQQIGITSAEAYRTTNNETSSETLGGSHPWERWRPVAGMSRHARGW